jgi:hypothetical protein
MFDVSDDVFDIVFDNFFIDSIETMDLKQSTQTIQ